MRISTTARPGPNMMANAFTLIKNSMYRTNRVISVSRTTAWRAAALTGVLFAVGCGRPEHRESPADTNSRTAGDVFTVHDSTVVGTITMAGVVQAMQQASLGSKLMSTVTRVNVREGDVVQAGDILLQLDARDLAARSEQVEATISEADATQRDATAQAKRLRALYADSAATRVQLEAAELAVTRADVTLRAAHAAASELASTRSYATLRAPFRGIVTQRLADEGTFASPGMPLIVMQDVSSVRIVASAAGENAKRLRRGMTVDATIDEQPVRARVEGVIGTGIGELFTINAVVPNGNGELRVGAAAALQLPTAAQRVLLVPLAAIRRDGDLTGVVVRGADRDEMRWIRIGAPIGSFVEVTAGLQAGDQVVVSGAQTKSSPVEGQR